MELTPIQQQVIASLAAGASISAAAKSAGVHRSTIHNWLNEPNFSTQFDTSRQHYVESLRDQLRDLSALALDTIRQIVENPDTPPSVRLRACLAILNRPSFPRQSWNLPEAIETPAEQLHRAETKALTADLDHLRLAESFDEPNEPNPPSTGRNTPCPCGSGRKYKRCCGVGAPPILYAA